MNLRLPGQYFDEETNSHHNFHRDYKPNQGRYLRSDPIGMLGGIFLPMGMRKNSLTTHVDLGVNILVGIYGAFRGGPWWVIAGIVLGADESMVLASIEHANYIRLRMNPAIQLLFQ